MKSEYNNLIGGIGALATAAYFLVCVVSHSNKQDVFIDLETGTTTVGVYEKDIATSVKEFILPWTNKQQTIVCGEDIAVAFDGIYGIEDFPADQMDVLEGDPEKAQRFRSDCFWEKYRNILKQFDEGEEKIEQTRQKNIADLMRK